MKRSKFNEEQISFALRSRAAGTPVENICRQLGVRQATFYVWKKQTHMGVSVASDHRPGAPDPAAPNAHASC